MKNHVKCNCLLEYDDVGGKVNLACAKPFSFFLVLMFRRFGLEKRGIKAEISISKIGMDYKYTL